MRAGYRPHVVVASLLMGLVVLGFASSAIAGDRAVLGEVFSGLG
jgi:hypothetical protein